ncbi:hypothetical protein Lalb_Chr01g0009531 [Lupinus albus]|uniref:Uncharacterized protein n=1 Tax=Lupinus albus TaxID=3870 RepID=A0A6A4R2L5_LUPAL|nr:hypothetical protein Lalb_Chr01g0009531 [Lupinus albus]
MLGFIKIDSWYGPYSCTNHHFIVIPQNYVSLFLVTNLSHFLCKHYVFVL